MALSLSVGYGVASALPLILTIRDQRKFKGYISV